MRNESVIKKSKRPEGRIFKAEFKMETFRLKHVELEREEALEFKLEQNALISDLKRKYAHDQGLEDARMRMYFKTDSGQIEGVEDDDKIADVCHQSGELLVQLSNLSVLDGQVNIEVEVSNINSNIAILMGGVKSFEHYLLNRENNALTLPRGNL